MDNRIFCQELFKRLQSGNMRSVSDATVTRNAEETVIIISKLYWVGELIDIIYYIVCPYASWAINFSYCYKN